MSFLAPALLIGHNPRAAVAAKVVKRPYLTIVAANDQRPLTTYVEGDETARLRYIGNVAGNLPVGAEDFPDFKLQKRLAVIGPARQPAAVPFLGGRYIPVAY